MQITGLKTRITKHSLQFVLHRRPDNDPPFSPSFRSLSNSTTLPWKSSQSSQFLPAIKASPILEKQGGLMIVVAEKELSMEL